MVHHEIQVKVAHDFERINPRLEISGFVAEQTSAHSNHRQEFPAADGARQFEASRLILSQGERGEQGGQYGKGGEYEESSAKVKPALCFFCNQIQTRQMKCEAFSGGC